MLSSRREFSPESSRRRTFEAEECDAMFGSCSGEPGEVQTCRDDSKSDIRFTTARNSLFLENLDHGIMKSLYKISRARPTRGQRSRANEIAYD